MAVPFKAPGPPVPWIAMPNPHIRKPSLSAHVADEDTIRHTNFDEDFPVPSIPREHQRTPPVSNDIGQAVTEYSPIDGTPRQSSPAPAVPKYTPRSDSKVNHASPKSKSSDSGYLSASSPETSKSPVVPMRSMFPVYNPSVALQQQQYYPQRPQATRQGSSSSRMVRQEIPPSASTPTGQAFVPPTPRGMPAFQLDTLTPYVSQPRDLADLWEATHGMEPNPKIKSYDLELARTEEATFTLGSTPNAPFYSMITYDTNEVALSKICPRKPTLRCEVSVNSIEAPARRMPPNDGLVTFIFPKMAAMLAINQSTALAQQHGLAPTHRDEVQAAAVKRAADQEACRLLWNPNTQNYELAHPALGRGVRDPEFVASPVSDQRSKFELRTTLDIQVAIPNGRSLPIVTIINPRASDLESSAPSIVGIRMSTLPQPDSDNSLITLDFNTRIMHINANQILEHLPSLFAVDSLVSAVMTVAIADSRVNPVMAAMEIWQPKPSRAMSMYTPSVAGRSNYAPSIAAKSTTGSVFYATLAEREEAEAEARELAEVHERDIRNQERRKQHRKWFGKSKSEKKSKSKTKKVTVKEFDLEKMGQYQSGSRKGEQLPTTVRAVLKVLVGGLRLIVWFLTAIVQLLTWLLVTCTRGVTSEKF